MTTGPNSLADRLKAKRTAEPAVPVVDPLTKEQRVLAWIDGRVQHLREFAKTVEIDDKKQNRLSSPSRRMIQSGSRVVKAAIEAGYVKPGESTIRSCKVFWIGATLSKRAADAKLDYKKMVQVLCDSIKENLRDC